jgi:hypothetical protein
MIAGVDPAVFVNFTINPGFDGLLRRTFLLWLDKCPDAY